MYCSLPWSIILRRAEDNSAPSEPTLLWLKTGGEHTLAELYTQRPDWVRWLSVQPDVHPVLRAEAQEIVFGKVPSPFLRRFFQSPVAYAGMFTFLMALSGLITFLNLMRGGSQWILVGMAMTVSIFLAVCTVLLLLAFLVEQSGGHVTEEAAEGLES
jgi:hypothetical protein